MDDIQNNPSRLESIRLTEGPEKCTAAFEEICKKDQAQAAALINDRHLTFPCLFILLPQIESFRLHSRLSPVKRTASRIAAQILKPAAAGHAGYLTEKNGAEYTALTWIWSTGKLEDGMSDDYEDVLDITVSVLINLYKDKTVLSDVCDMIFARAKKGHNIHDLVWAFFRSNDPLTLRLIAQRLVSPRDSALACRLLGTEASPSGDDTNKQMETYQRWLDENEPYLYFTDESFQITSEPAFYRIDLERKYIQASAANHTKQRIVTSNKSENQALEAFRGLGDEQKRVLADYSHTIHGDLPRWKMWMALPIGEQYIAAAQNREDV